MVSPVTTAPDISRDGPPNNSPPRYLRRFTLAHGVAASLLVHAFVTLSLYGALNWHTQQKQGRRGKWLNVELSGIVSNRQVQAQQRRVEAVRSGGTGPRAGDQKRDKSETAPKGPAPVLPSEPPLDLPDAVRLPALSGALTAALGPSGSLPRAGGDYAQRQQYLGNRNDGGDRLSAYLADLTKRVRANLLYPYEARRKRMEGVSLIGFVVAESGEIKPGTLMVKKSSGYASLDASALKTAAGSAPFPKPPRELSVSIAVAFEVE